MGKFFGVKSGDRGEGNRDEGVNFSNWEDAHFQHLLKLSEQEKDVSRRLKYLADAEEILVKESPIIPLCYEKNYFVKNSNLKIHSELFSRAGNYDFSQISFAEKK